MDLGTVLASAVVAALISGLVAIRNNERKIVIGNVTRERTKWREKVREINKEVQKAFSEKDQKKLQELKSELRLLLNPFDTLDRDILNGLAALQTEASKQEDFDRFSIKLSLLLKHDWERAKNEAYSSVFCKKDVKRVSYEEYLKRTANQPLQPIADKAGSG